MDDVIRLCVMVVNFAPESKRAVQMVVRAHRRRMALLSSHALTKKRMHLKRTIKTHTLDAHRKRMHMKRTQKGMHLKRTHRQNECMHEPSVSNLYTCSELAILERCSRFPLSLRSVINIPSHSMKNLASHIAFLDDR